MDIWQFFLVTLVVTQVKPKGWERGLKKLGNWANPGLIFRLIFDFVSYSQFTDK